MARKVGADATIRLDQRTKICDAFARQAGNSGYQVVIDYVWGRPTEALLAAVLRSTALTIRGTAGIPPGDVLAEAFEMVMLRAARGELHIDTERVPLAAIEDAWQQTPQPHRAADWS